MHSDAVLSIRIYTILFFECPLYNQIRRNLFLILQIYEDISLEVRLCGKYNLVMKKPAEVSQRVGVFDIVMKKPAEVSHEYIKHTHPLTHFSRCLL
jgi:hypothetical protein